MKGEIDNDFYCAQAVMARGCPNEPHCFNCCSRHHKWPTPEQFKEEYGREPPPGILVWAYFRETIYEHGDWMFGTYEVARECNSDKPCVIACTPWGKPPDDWEPETAEDGR